MVQINSLWVGNRLSTMEVLSVVSHLKVGHEYSLWTYGPVANVPAGVVARDAREVMPEADVFAYQTGEGKGSYSACSNLFRYRLFIGDCRLEGWWCDTDVVALKRFVAPDRYWAFASERMRSGLSKPTTCVMKMSAGFSYHCFLKAEAAAKDRDKLEWGVIGPNLLGEMVATYPFNVAPFVLPPEAFCPVSWFDAEDDPPVAQPPDLSRSYAVHLWHEMWRRKGLDKDGAYPPTCLYERLKDAILRS